jgi:transposase
MYFRCSPRRYKDRKYLSYQLVESHRHPETRKPTTRVIASLGDLSKMDDEARLKLVASLARVLEVEGGAGATPPELAGIDLSDATSRARSIGAMWAILELLRQLHLPQAWAEITSGRKNDSALANHLTALICHRLDDPGSKLSLLRWLETVHIPGVDADDITYQGLLRTMDVLLEHKCELERALADRVLTMFDTELDLVLMDLTSVSVCTREVEHSLFAHGKSRDGHPERKQYTLMLVTTKDGIPLYHEVHEGNASDAKLVEHTMQQVRQLFPQIDRCMVVGDRGMLSKSNTEALAALGFGHVIAAPMKRETWIRELIDETHDELLEQATSLKAATKDGEQVPDAVVERQVGDERVIVAYSMDIGRRQERLRDKRLDRFEEIVADVEARLQSTKPTRGRQLTDEGAFKRLVREAVERQVTAYFKIELRQGNFLWVEPVDEVWQHAWRCDGKLAITTDNHDLPADDLIRIYKDLQEIERSFRTLKSHLKIRPTFHWTEQRVRAHVLLCVLALTVERVMRLKLKKAQSGLSPQSALDELKRLLHVAITLPDRSNHHLLANTSPRQLDLFRDLHIQPLTNSRLRKLVA